jgi:hypothetical protein
MEHEKYSFHPNSLLIQDIVKKSLGSDLYRIGLSHYRFGSKNRSILLNPFLVFTITFVLWMKFNLTLIIRPENKDISIMIGDFSYFLGIRNQYNLFSIYFIFIYFNNI